MSDLSRTELLDEATRIAEGYRDDGYDLTLRQLYYALVSAGLIGNSQKNYIRLGDVIGAARLEGDFDPDLLVDRGRKAGKSAHAECLLDVNVAIDDTADYLRQIPALTIRTDAWFGQRTYVSVWVEKDALTGVFHEPCEKAGVGFFACKGYPSHSSLWQWLQGLQEAYQASTQGEIMGYAVAPIEEAVVLYFGDHDPDGWQIPRTAEQTLRQMAHVYELDVPEIRFVRVALNMDQIKQYDPPPFPAKMTSARYKSYIDEHQTADAWELDALKPDVLKRLIEQNVDRYYDRATRLLWANRAREARGRLIREMLEDGWLERVLRSSR